MADTKDTKDDGKARSPPASPPAPAAGAVAAATAQQSPEPTQPPAVPSLYVDEEFQGQRDDDQDSAIGDDAASSTASITSSILQYRTINGRTYHSERAINSETGHYWGANDDRQNDNLDLMHQMFTLALDDKLYLAPLPDKLEKVLDIGTGTGLWCIDFGDDHPDCEVIGTDLSPIQPTWMPQNVSFQIDDYTQEWTFEDNSLDYVHLRWLVGTVSDWAELFRQAYRVLKPGGYIESFECNGFYESDDGTMTDDTHLSKWGYFFREGSRAIGSKASFSVVRDGLQVKGLEEAGFTRITEHLVKIPTSDWAKDPKYKQIGLLTRAALENDTEGAIGFFAAKLGWTKDEITVYAAQLRKELRAKSVHAYFRSNVVYAQKPLSS